MSFLRFAGLTGLLLTAPSALAQLDGFGSLGLGGGAFFAEATPGLYDSDSGTVLPFAGAEIRVIQSPVLVGFYLDLHLVSLSSVQDDVLAEQDLAFGLSDDTALAMNVGATLPLPMTDDSAFYLLGGLRLADAVAYSGAEVGGGLWLGLGEGFAVHAEGGYLFADQDVTAGPLTFEQEGAVFARGGLGIRIAD